MKNLLKKLPNFPKPLLLITAVFMIVSGILGFQLYNTAKQNTTLSEQYSTLKNQDQIKINKDLTTEIKNIHDSYLNASQTYQKIVDLRDQKQDTKSLDQQLAQVLKQLSDKDYNSANTSLSNLNSQIETANQKLAAAQIPKTQAGNPSAPVNNAPPGSGFSQQQVQTDQGTFTVDIIAANLNSTKVIVDTASSSDCGNNCPVLPLSTYVSRNGAYAGINGSFFCPASYPSCAGKTNSFDTLLMNKDKHYFNSDNNIYSNIPAAIFSPGSARFVGASSQWGRDTSVDSVIANYPLLIAGGNIAFNGSDDPKFGSAGSRCFIATKSNMVYIGCVLGATMDNAAHVMKALGMDSALNLDEGGSTALYSGGYKLGPGRDIPNAVLFISR